MCSSPSRRNEPRSLTRMGIQTNLAGLEMSSSVHLEMLRTIGHDRNLPATHVGLGPHPDRGPYTLEGYESQPASDRDLPAATTERPAVISEERTTSPQDRARATGGARGSPCCS